MEKLIEKIIIGVKLVGKGNRESLAFEKALSEGNELEFYQIAFGNRYWLINRGIIKESDLPELEKLAQGVGKTYHYNGKSHIHANYKNDEYHGLYEEWYNNGKLRARKNYKNGKRHGLCEEWYSDGWPYLRNSYKNGKLVT